MEKSHLVILSEENEPVIRGQCSSCPEVLFVLDRTVECSLRIVHEMFDAHLREFINATNCNDNRVQSRARHVRPGDLLWVEHADKTSRFKVVWVRDSESQQLIQAAIHRLQTEPCPWSRV
jgi:hypothetical protein